MSEKTQIEEMARFVCSSFHGHHDCEKCSLYEERCCVSLCAAKRLYNAGFRKQSKGEWVKDNASQFKHRYNCSVCDYRFLGIPTPYCPNCGSKMKGV